MKKYIFYVISVAMVCMTFSPLVSKRRRAKRAREIEKISEKMVRHAGDGNRDIVEKYLLEGAKVNFKTKKKHETALYKAASNGHEKMVEFLLSIGARVDERNKKGETPLHGAVEKSHDKMVRILLQAGADVNAQDNKGRTALMKAANKAYEFIATILLEAGANLELKNKKGQTARYYSRGVISKMFDAWLKKPQSVKSK